MTDDEQHPGYAPVAEITRLYGIANADVYRLAWRHKWRRYTLDGHVRYHREDVERTFDAAQWVETRRVTWDDA